MFYYRVADPVVEMDGQDNFDALSDKLFELQCNRGIVNSEAISLLDKVPENKSVIIPIKRNKDGSITNALKEAEFGLLRDFATKKMKQMGQEIMTGHIEKAPYMRNEREHGCQYCPELGA